MQCTLEKVEGPHPKMGKRKKVKHTLYISLEDLEVLKLLATSEGLTISDYIVKHLVKKSALHSGKSAMHSIERLE